MGSSRITQVINALQFAGLRTARGFVAAAMPEPTEPVAAVYIQELTARESKLAVTVYTTAALGGILCEDAAIQAMQALRQLGAQCRMGGCGFDGRSGLFSVTVTAAFRQTLPFGVLIDGQRQDYVTQLTITDRNELKNQAEAVSGGWEITLVELLPENMPPEQRNTAEFMLTVEHPGGMEQYSRCRWERSTLSRTAEGMERTRVARTWTEKTLAEG